jgi:hypothetical protein
MIVSDMDVVKEIPFLTAFDYHEVRFHLSSGKYYKHWQIKTYDQSPFYEVNYFDPFYHQLILHDCELVNKPNTAEKVLREQRRDVCGWVKCSRVSFVRAGQADLEKIRMVAYDPKVRSHWHYENQTDNIDGTKFDRLITYQKRVYCEHS